MAEAGSTAERVKQQADIVRIVGEYVRLKKTGKDFSGLCPFHQEKTPSFTVSPIKQIFYCFGCGKGGDIFNFVMEMERCEFPDALRIVAEKCGISIPKPKPSSPAERTQSSVRTTLVEMHREAQTFFVNQLQGTAEGKLARAYLDDRGLDKTAIDRFGIGYAPSGGDLLLRHLKAKYAEKLLAESGLVSREQNGSRLFDRFRRRITFPIANEGGKIVAFGCRALGDDQPKYLNSPETPIYSKSNLLYHLDRAKEALRRSDFAVLVEGYVDAIAVARAGVSNVVASCGTSLAEPQIKLLGRFTKRVIVNYDPDTAGQAATERSIAILLEQDFEVRVLALPGKADPDKFIRDQGADAYIKLIKESESDIALGMGHPHRAAVAAGRTGVARCSKQGSSRATQRSEDAARVGRARCKAGGAPANSHALGGRRLSPRAFRATAAGPAVPWTGDREDIYCADCCQPFRPNAANHGDSGGARGPRPQAVLRNSLRGNQRANLG